MTSLITLAHPALLAAAKKTTSSSSSLFLVFLVVIAVAFYFLFMRPQQKKQRQQRQLQGDIHEGDEVVTVGGIVGRVLKMEDDRVHLVTGYHGETELGDHQPHRMTFVRNAISRKVDPATADSSEDDDDSADEFAFEHEDATGTAGNGHAGLSYLENGHVEAGSLDDVPVEDGEVLGTADTADATSDAVSERTRRRGRGRAAGGGTREGTSP